MKKILQGGIAIMVMVMSTNVNAQQNTMADIDPTLPEHNNNGFYPRALWDIQFNHDLTTAAAGDAGMAAGLYYNNEYWVSRWANDTLYRFDMAGALVSEFVIAGLTGTRSLTTDGTYLYAGTAGNTIYRIDPGTQTLAPPHITVGGAVTVRYCAYDSTLNAGAGGFWIGNFNTDIESVSMTGTLLSTIPVATHGLGGMYGAAVDHYSTGGPYLWMFHQGGTNQTELTRLQLPAGTQTGITHDVMSDVGAAQSLTNGLAGGCFITNQIVPGQVTIGGIVQGTPNNLLFGYELADPTPDAGVSGLRPVQGYTQIPNTQVVADSFQIDIVNSGGILIDTVYVDLTVDFGASTVYSEQLQILSMAAGSATLYSNLYTPASGVGDYTVRVATSTSLAQADLTPVNDTMSFVMSVTDSIYARDNGIPDGGPGYAVSGADWGYAAALFRLHSADTVAGIWIEIATPVDGDTTYGIMVPTSSSVPLGAVTMTGIQIINSAQNVYYMPFSGGLPLAAGLYTFGCYEGVGTTINLAQSTNLYTPNVNFYYTVTSDWTPSGIQTARFIRPVFKRNGPSIGIETNNYIELSVYPNPTYGVLNIAGEDLVGATYQIFDIQGKVVKTGILNNQGGIIDISEMANGNYLLRVMKDGQYLGSSSIIKK